MYGAILFQHIFEFNWDFPSIVSSFNNKGTHYIPLNITAFLETHLSQAQSSLTVVFYHTACDMVRSTIAQCVILLTNLITVWQFTVLILLLQCLSNTNPVQLYIYHSPVHSWPNERLDTTKWNLQLMFITNTKTSKDQNQEIFCQMLHKIIKLYNKTVITSRIHLEQMSQLAGWGGAWNTHTHTHMLKLATQRPEGSHLTRQRSNSQFSVDLRYKTMRGCVCMWFQINSDEQHNILGGFKP